jgi:hypothetical protein
LAFLPFLLTSVLSFLVGMRRVQDFLCADEVKLGGNVAALDETLGTVRITGGEFCWDVEEQEASDDKGDGKADTAPVRFLGDARSSLGDAKSSTG